METEDFRIEIDQVFNHITDFFLTYCQNYLVFRLQLVVYKARLSFFLERKFFLFFW